MNASSAASSSAPSEAAQQSHGTFSLSGDPAVSVAQHPLPSSDHPPGFASALPTSQAPALHSSQSTGENGNTRDSVRSDLAQPVHEALPPNKHDTWSSEGEDGTPLHASEHDASPGYGPPGYAPLGTPHRQAAVQPSSSMAAGNGLVQPGADRPPGFAARTVPEQSNLLGSDRTDQVPSSDGHPPGFAQPNKPLTHPHQGSQHGTADQPPGFRQGTVQLNTPVSASTAEPPVPARSTANTARNRRAQASAASSPAASASAPQRPPAASSVTANVPPGFPASPSPSSYPAEIHTTDLLPTRSHGRTATSSRLQASTAASPLHSSYTAEKPPGFETAGIGGPQACTQAQPAGALQAQKAVQGSSKAQQLQHTPQTARQTSWLSSHATEGEELPPGFPTRSQSSAPAVQSASSQQQPTTFQGSLVPTSAGVGGDLPPGFPAQSQSSAPAVQSASGIPRHAPKIVSVTKLPSAPTAGQMLNQQPSTSAAAADDLPPGFSIAPSAAASSVSHLGTSQARASNTAFSKPVDGQSGWDIDDLAINAADNSHVRHQHASAGADLPPGFAIASQQPTPASQRSATGSQRQPGAVAPVSERRVSVTKLPTTPSGLASTFPKNPPAQVPRSVPVTRLPSSGPNSTPPTAPQSVSNTKRKTRSQALSQSSAAAADSSLDLPPGFPTMQRSSSTPGGAAAAAATSRAAAVHALSSKASAGRGTSSSDAADMAPGITMPGAAPQDPAGLPPGFPADNTPNQAPKVVGVPKGGRKETGRRAEVPLPQSGLQRSDARRKAQIPKVDWILHSVIVCVTLNLRAHVTFTHDSLCDSHSRGLVSSTIIMYNHEHCSHPVVKAWCTLNSFA